MKHLFFALLLLLSWNTTAFSSIIGEPVIYKSGDFVMQGYLSYDDSISGKRPGILVVHEWWGQNEYARERARMLAELGYTALAVDMYGEGKVAEHPADAGKFAEEVRKNMATATQRFKAAMHVLQEHPTVDPDHIAAIGYCFGGGIVLEMAREGLDLDAVVSFHGSLTTDHPAEPGKVKARVLVCHGEADKLTTPEQLKSFLDEMKNAGVDFKFISYPGAKHSFTNPGADIYAKKFNMDVIGYNPEADHKSWEDMKEFLKETFAK
jgi:dienelactone hydrolase